MSEKRFIIKSGTISNNYPSGRIFDNEKQHTLYLDEVVNLLNEQEQKIQRWKTLYEIKDAEVTARVKRLNEICNQYKHTITFDKDIDPNDAVNILCDRILQTEVEM